jgi:putative ATPase
MLTTSKDNFVEDNYLPEEISGTLFYEPGINARELEIRKQLETRWQKIYKYKYLVILSHESQ